MNKRVLMVATVPSMIGQFNRNNIKILKDLGYDVDIAADFNDTSVWAEEKTQQFIQEMKSEGNRCFQIDFSRDALNIADHIKSFNQVLKLIRNRKYGFIHTHTPIASAIVRVAAVVAKTKVIYTAHGFHFFKGAPLKNWLIYYPIEWICSFFTDVLITITKEDYRLAKRHMHTKKVVYVPGVGVDTNKFKNGNGDKIRKELGIDKNDLMLLSVGELNENKNHEMVIRALAKMDHPPVYVIVGRGDLKDHLQSVADELGIKLILTGYRNDVVDFYHAADIYCLPSIREGLNVSIMEAMASGLPVVCGNIRGNKDMIDPGKGGLLCDPMSVHFFAKAFDISKDKYIRDTYGKHNIQKIDGFSVNKVNTRMNKIYSLVMRNI